MFVLSNIELSLNKIVVSLSKYGDFYFISDSGIVLMSYNPYEWGDYSGRVYDIEEII